jgi:PAS domain S-box-containing protein
MGAETELHKLEHQVMAELVMLSHGFWYEYLDSRGGIYVSAEYLKLYGYTSIDEMPTPRIKLVVEEDRRRVKQTIHQAIRNPGQIYEVTFRIITKEGTIKWIFSRVKHFDLGGRPILASLHTDITPLKRDALTEQDYLSWQVFHLKLINLMPGFVFVKERVPVNGQIRYEFRYANQTLVEAFGKKYLAEVVGKTDADFLSNISEIRRFEIGDAKVYEPGYQVVASEENFTPAQTGSTLRRLVTVKTPFLTSIFNNDNEPRLYVLGVAVDVTTINDLFHNAIAASQDPMFVKDSGCRYSIVNKAFVSMLGAKTVDQVVGHTFREVLESVHANSCNGNLFSVLIDEINQEDCQVLRGRPVLKVSQLDFGDSKTWQREKVPIYEPDGIVSHIFGCAHEVDDWKGVYQKIFDNVRESICVKDDSFKVVRYNAEYGRRHNAAGNELVGKTDFEMWSDRPDQAEHCRSSDQAVLRLAKAREAALLSGDEATVNACDNTLENYSRGFIENQTWHDKSHHKMLTKKWPFRIMGRWHIFVVCSDVTTPIASEKGEIHVSLARHLGHALKQSIPGLESSELVLRESGKIAEAMLLKETIFSLKATVEIAVSIAKLETLNQSDEINLLRLIKSKVDSFSDDRIQLLRPDGRIIVRCDIYHLSTAIGELLSNARDFAPSLQKGGRIRVWCESNISSAFIHIEDNGPGIADSFRQNLFQFGASFGKSRTGMGLFYVQKVIDSHGGSVREIGKFGVGAYFIVELPLKNYE